MKVEGRIQWVDLLKGFAIMWLVVYHFYEIDWLRSPVPIFFFLSGLFFSEGKSFRSFVSKKAKALLVPFLFFFVLGVGASALKSIIAGDIYTFPQLWRFATFIPADAEKTNPLGVGAIWFLASLFEIYIIYYLIRKVSKNSWWLLSAAIFFFLISAVTMQKYGNGSLFYLFYTCGFIIYFIVADLLREKILFSKIPKWVLIASACICSIRFVDISNLLNFSEITGGGGLMRLKGVISMMGAIGVLICIGKWLSDIRIIRDSKIYNFVLFEGRNSLTILGVHLLVMGVVSLFLKRTIPIGVIYYTVQFFIVLAVCNICIVMFNRYVPFLVNHKNRYR